MDPQSVNNQIIDALKKEDSNALSVVNAPAKEPQVFEYDNYRAYLKDYYCFQKFKNTAYSLRVFSRQAGYRSASFFKMVMDGQRDLTEDGIENFSRALKLTNSESEFFRNLVHFNQAETIESKQRFAHEMTRSKTFEKLRPLTRTKFQYLSHWYNVAIRELITLDGFREDNDWIASMLIPAITPQQAANAIRLLSELGLIARNAEGKLVQTEADIVSGDEVISNSIAQFHREMILRGREAIDVFEKKDRQIAAVTIAVDEATQEKVHELARKFRKDLLALAHQPKATSQIMQINVQLFPLSKKVSP